MKWGRSGSEISPVCSYSNSRADCRIENSRGPLLCCIGKKPYLRIYCKTQVMFALEKYIFQLYMEWYGAVFTTSYSLRAHDSSHVNPLVTGCIFKHLLIVFWVHPMLLCMVSFWLHFLVHSCSPFIFFGIASFVQEGNLTIAITVTS